VLDAEQRRLLIEGCCYRYVVRVKDVSSVEPVSGYALSGARLVCRMSGHLVDLGLTSSGQGPLASLTQAFAPSALAAGLASRVNLTLFGTEVSTHRQGALPPPIPMANEPPVDPQPLPVAERAPVDPQPPRLI
jgi:hypothetical protein